MIRQLILLSALAVVVVLASTLSADSPCIYPYLEKGDYKTGKTVCNNATTDCADAAATCMHNYFEKKAGRLCCKQVANVVVPTCPNGAPTLLNPATNQALKTWVYCNPVKTAARKASCPHGYSCVQATNTFTGSDATKYVCCK